MALESCSLVHIVRDAGSEVEENGKTVVEE